MAYFVPDPETMKALTEAAKRGVDVSIIVPSFSDFWAVFHAGRSKYEDLLEAGVKIHERNDRLLHAKTAVVDGVWSTVGSANLDWRSFIHNNELNLVILGQGFGDQMEAAFQDDVSKSVEITKESWANRPIKDRVLEASARVWQYWL
jgi:cardiolipin synthase